MKTEGFENIKGYLQKKSRKKIIKWHERFFSIKNNRLYWYKTHKSLQSISSISLDEFNLDYKGKKIMRFNVAVPERNIKLQANTAEDKEKWLRALKKPKSTEISVSLYKDTSAESIYEDFNNLTSTKNNLMKVANTIVAEIPKRKNLKTLNENPSSLPPTQETTTKNSQPQIQTRKSTLKTLCKCFDFLKPKPHNSFSEPLIIN